MIRILVVSDSHGDVNLLHDLFLKYQHFDYFLHLGDSQIPPSLLEPFISVKGNCDFGNDYPKIRTIVTPYGKIHMEHGNSIRESVFSDESIRIFLCGHTHIGTLQTLPSGAYFVNPGSLTRPRDGRYGSYLTIEWDEKGPKFEFHEVI